MQIKIHALQNTSVAEIISESVIINNVQDALDLMANVGYQGTEKMILRDHQLHPDFFILSTRLAGDILQKFTNYKVQLAIIGDFSSITSKSLKDFIYESNKRGLIMFVPSLEQALERLNHSI